MSAPRPAVERQHFPDAPKLQRFHDQAIEALAKLQAPWVNGARVDVGAVSAGAFNVQHRLGRVPEGFFVLKAVRESGATTAASIFQRTGDTLTASALGLYTTADIDALSLWVW